MARSTSIDPDAMARRGLEIFGEQNSQNAKKKNWIFKIIGQNSSDRDLTPTSGLSPKGALAPLKAPVPGSGTEAPNGAAV